MNKADHKSWDVLNRRAAFIQEPHSGDLEEMEISLLDKGDLAAATTDGRVALLNHALGISLAAQNKKPDY